MPKHIIRRRRRWYAYLDVPKRHQKRLKQTRFIESLKTESKTEAERLALPLISIWKAKIAECDKKVDTTIVELSKISRYAKIFEPDEYFDSYSEYLSEAYSPGHPAPSMKDRAAELYLEGERNLGDHLEQYLFDYEKTVTPKTFEMAEKEVREFVKRFPLSANVTKRSLSQWITDHLRTERKLSDPTIRRIVSSVSLFLKFFDLQEDKELASRIPSIPKAPKKVSAKESRQDFTKSDYSKFMAEKIDHDLRALIRLGAYTGCRIEELCSLRVEDATDRLNIRVSKTSDGVREVPIHSHIADLVENLKNTSTDGYLISDLKPNKYGHRSNAIGKRFGRLKTSMGYGSEHVFHCWRKGIITLLEEAITPEIIVARIMGHKIATMSYGTYSGGVSIDKKREAIERISWEV